MLNLHPLLCLVFPMLTLSPTVPADAPEDLSGSHAAFVEAWQGGNVEKVRAFLSEGAAFFPASGGDATSMTVALRSAARSYAGRPVAEVLVHRGVARHGNTAVITDVARVDYESSRWKPSVPLRRTVVWVRQEDTWRVAHVHHSRYTNFETSIGAFEAADKAGMPKPGGVVFVGSSSIRGWKALADDFPGVNTVHRGFGGSQLVDSILYANRIITKYAPSRVVVYAGDNDVAAGKDAARVFHDFKLLVKSIHGVVPEAKVGFIAIKPSISRWEMWGEMKKANELIAKFAASHPRVTYLDIATPMLGADGKPRPELFVGDGLHMTPAGYEVWTAIVRPWVSP